jgi:hypothetical protein
MFCTLLLNSPILHTVFLEQWLGILVYALEWNITQPSRQQICTK